MSDTKEQILNDIQSLQNIEKQMFSSLNSTPNLSSDEKSELASKIKEVSTIRESLYESIGGTNNFYRKH